MNKYTFVFVLLTSLMLTSCGSKIEKDIKALNETDIKGVKVQTIKIDKDYYQYAPEYIEANNAFEDEFSKQADLLDKMADASDYIGIYSYDYKQVLEYSAQYDSYRAQVDSLKPIIDSLTKITEDIQASHNQGTLYVARFTAKDKYGNWKQGKEYHVYTYDDSGKLSEYEGDEAISIIMSAFPDAKKELVKNLEEFFTGLAE